MDIEHFGFLSSVIRKRESHEQDGETLPREILARTQPASGDPAMALRSSFSVSAGGPFHPGFTRQLLRAGQTTADFSLSMIFSENRFPLFGIMLTPAFSARGNSMPRAKTLSFA
ncbi:MAG: hypothetical protein WDO17_00155 [Alphaproteobacteria bacterium]